MVEANKTMRRIVEMECRPYRVKDDRFIDLLTEGTDADYRQIIIQATITVPESPSDNLDARLMTEAKRLAEDSTLFRSCSFRRFLPNADLLVTSQSAKKPELMSSFL